MRENLLDIPLANALSSYHEWDEHTRTAYLKDISRDDVLADHYFHERTRRPPVPLVKPRSVNVNTLHWDLVPGFSDVYAVGVANEVLFRFRCSSECNRARVIKACGDYGVSVRYVSL